MDGHLVRRAKGKSNLKTYEQKAIQVSVTNGKDM